MLQGSAAFVRLVACAVVASAVVAVCAGGAFSAHAARPKTEPLAVHVIYAVPTDRAPRASFEHAINGAVLDLQAWYLGQVGKTFAIAGPAKICHLPHPVAYYLSGTWGKLTTDVQPCGNVEYSPQATAKAIWILYADVDHKCNAPEPIGMGESGLTLLGRQDLNGLTGAPYHSDCGQPFVYPPGRYIGGLGHELGHAFGLPHPPGCDRGLPLCHKNENVIMWSGYASWPNTYFDPAERAQLAKDRFLTLTKSKLPVIHGSSGGNSGGGGSGGGGGGSPTSCTSGAYQGTTSQGHPVSFTVTCSTTGGIVTSLSFARIDETCTSGSATTSFSVPQLPFGADGGIHLTATGQGSFQINGTIASGKANGTMHVDGPTAGCTADITWNASS